ncbi:MAG: PA domain-containing protein [Marinicella sp.]
MRILKPLIIFLAFIGIAIISQQNIAAYTASQLKAKSLSKGQDKPAKQYDKPDKAAAWLASMRHTPKGFSPAQLNLAYQNEMKAAKALKANQNLPALHFDEIGPGIFGGRIRGFVMHPEREGHLLAGGVSGGVWKSTDGGQSWHPKTDFLASIAIGSMLIDPDDPETVYAGTGEGFSNFDAAQGYGIFVSNDFGETWERYGFTNRTDFYYVNRMVKIPGTDSFLAATRTGIFKTTDEGRIWNEMTGVTTSRSGFVDLKLDPSDPNHLLAYHFGSPNLEIADMNVSTPPSVSGNYNVVKAQFGPSFPGSGLAGEMLLIQDSGGTNGLDGCETIINDIAGKIALIERGNCNFIDKVLNAQSAGATAAIIFNDNRPMVSMALPEGVTDTSNIPSGMIQRTLGDLLRSGIPPVLMTITDRNKLEYNRFAMRSTNGGDFWASLTNHGLPGIDLERMEIGFGADGNSYIAVSQPVTEVDGVFSPGTIGLFKSNSPSSQNFSKTASNTNFVERQGWYDLAIAVNPDNSSHVLVGAVDQFVTTNAGSTITQNSYWNPDSGFMSQYIHADHHGYFFSPHNSDHIYVASDGGIAKSEDGGESYISLNNGLNISQIYGLAVSPDGQRVTSGTQDNGSQLYFGNEQAWIEWAGGDGGFSAWDQQDSDYVYGSQPEGDLFGSSNGGLSARAFSLPDTEGARFIQPFVLDENDGNRMMVGTDNIFYTTNARAITGAGWTDVSGTIIAGRSVSTLAFNPHQSTTAYAGMEMFVTDVLSTNQIVKITGLGSSNTVTNIAPPNSFGTANAVVTDIKVDLFDTSGNTLYATFGSYNPNRILRSTDGGNNWTSISNNLPDIPLFQVVNDPADANTLYVGSELGLWVGTKSGSTYNWEQFDYGPAYTRVIDLVWNNDDLYVGTHGRGTYKASKNPFEVSVIKFIATNSSCDVDNFLDRGESGKLMIQINNLSAKDFGQVSLSFNQPNFISFTDANQSFALNGFSSHIIALNVELDSQASCLADISIPATITSNVGTFNQDLTVLTSANQSVKKGIFTDGAERSDSLMQSVITLGDDGWIRTTDSANSGNNSWFTTNESSYSDKSLVTPWLTFDGGGNVLKFAMSYDTERDSVQLWDGLVLEMRFQGHDNWFDIGHLSSVPYDGQLFTNNTAQGQFAWSGTQLEWRDVTVNLGTQYIGKTAQIRFRMVSDQAISQDGFWIDDISVSRVITGTELSCDECISDGNSVVPNKGLWYDPAHDGHGFIIEAFGANDLFYTLFYTYDDNGDPEWFNSLTSLSGGVLNAGFETNTLEKFRYNYAVDPAVVDPLIPDSSLTDGRLSIDFNSASVRNHPACQDGTSRQLNFVALATWQINDVTEAWCIEPLIDDAARPEPDFGTAWWAGTADNGWGYSLAQTGDVIIAFLFYYDADGNSRWSTGITSGFAANEDITLPMTDVFGYGRTASPIGTTFVDSGSIVLNLSNTFRDLTTDGVNTIDVTYQGPEGGRWFRDSVQIMTLLQEH